MINSTELPDRNDLLARDAEHMEQSPVVQILSLTSVSETIIADSALLKEALETIIFKRTQITTDIIYDVPRCLQ